MGFLTTTQTSMAALSCNFTGSRMKGHSWLHAKLEVCLGYIRVWKLEDNMHASVTYYVGPRD